MMCAIFLSHFVFAVFWRTLVAFGFVFHHDWFCRLYKYVRSVTLDGVKLGTTISHDRILKGGRLVFEMTSEK